MKILHVVPYFYPAWAYGGPPRAVYEIARQQVKQGHDVSVLTTTAYEKNEELIEGLTKVNDITVYRAKNLNNFVMWNYHFSTPFNASHFLSKHTFDCIHIHEVRTLLTYLAMTKGKTDKVILSPWGTLPYNDSLVPIKKGLDLFLQPLLQKKIDLSLAQTKHEKRLLQQFKLGRSVQIVPLGITKKTFDKLPSKSNSRKRLGLDQKKYYFLFLGRFSPYKGIDNILRAFSVVKQQISNSELLLVGRDDGYLNEINRLIQQLNLHAATKVLPPMYDSDRLYAYRASDCFVFTPTVYEETGTASLEALACGRPVITNDKAEVPIMLRQDGVYHTTSLDKSISDLMLQVHKDKPTVNTKKFFSNFSWEKISKDYIQHYQAE